MSKDIIEELQKFVDEHSKCDSAWVGRELLQELMRARGPKIASEHLAIRGNIFLLMAAIMSIYRNDNPNQIRTAIYMTFILGDIGVAHVNEKGGMPALDASCTPGFTAIWNEFIRIRAQVLKSVKDMPDKMFHENPWRHRGSCLPCTLRAAALDDTEAPENVKILPGVRSNW